MTWLYRRIPHRGLFYGSTALLLAVFVRLAANPEILIYEPRGDLRILNWYFYTYLVCAAAMFVAAWWMSDTSDRLFAGLPRVPALLRRRSDPALPAAEHRDRRFLLHGSYNRVQVRRDGLAGSDVHDRLARLRPRAAHWPAWLSAPRAGLARMTAVALIAVTTLKCVPATTCESLGGPVPGRLARGAGRCRSSLVATRPAEVRAARRQRRLRDDAPLARAAR